jgi:hypothetical protein
MMDFFEGAEYQYIGSITPVAARKVNNNFLELSWYPNTFDRFHEVSIRLPRDQYIVCVGSWQCDEKPHVFVKSEWLEQIHRCLYSTFAMIDAIGVKKALEEGTLTRKKLIALREKIDHLAQEHLNISFISFADSLLLKSNWTVGHHGTKINYDYEPEVFIRLAKELNKIYQECLGLNAYAVIAQGGNEYYKDNLLHISDSNNHVSLNSLGIPFAQIMEIETAARKAIKSGTHQPAELYMDERYFHSLKLKYEFEKNNKPSNSYRSKMIKGRCKYYYTAFDTILDNLDQRGHVQMPPLVHIPVIQD